MDFTLSWSETLTSSSSSPLRSRKRVVALALGAAVLLLLVGAWWGGVKGEGPVPGAPVSASSHLLPWDRFLKRHVDSRGDVAYASACADPDLAATLSALASADGVSTLSPSDRLAFRINAYNAYTVFAICRNRPLRSLKDKPWEWTTRRIAVGRAYTTLNDLETAARKDPPRDARVHFAVNCASASCPVLRGEAYQGTSLEAQLADQERRFLVDRFRNPGPSRDGSQVNLSSIFNWYAADFAVMSVAGPPFPRHPPGQAVALRLLHRYGDPALRAQLEKGTFSVVFVDYDWSLNEARTR